ncbi:MAG: recombinase family protein [Lachnospiraceae bacterium]|nr:recombinase family protein [Lachnospiraceae bacterium]
MEKKRVVFYGRVSTQSDEQLSALGNQMTWYDQLLMQHPEWTVVDKYEDAGVTGTSVCKRRGFQQMLEDGIKRHKYDLIVTRETRRFARNTVDALSYVRLLKQNGIEVYFVNDGIRTISDNDGELRLSIMATIAQEESRKTSENVRAGQRISRQKGVLRGSGNILGYKRVGKNQYEIDPEQALIVRKIYDWYVNGDGMRVIQRRLEGQGYQTATGKSHWQLQVIADILSNPFYTGRQRQLCRVSDGYLTQKRVKNDPDKMEYIRGNYEPLISEELFEEVKHIRERRYNKRNSRGKRESKSVWCGKTLCGCGCGTVRRIASGEEFIFICHSQHTRGIRKKTETGETDRGKTGSRESEEACTRRTILEWKLDMIAHYVINDVWKNSREDISRALEIIAECYKEKDTLSQLESDTIKNKLEKLEKRKRGLMDMRADGEITKEEYAVKKQECDIEICNLKVLIAKADTDRSDSKDFDERISSIQSAMKSIFDLSKPKLNKNVVDGFIWKLVHISDNEFDLYLSMGSDSFGSAGTEEKVIRYKVFEYPNPERAERIKCTKLKTMRLTYEDAVRYRAMSGRKVMKNKWEDLLVNIYI